MDNPIRNTLEIDKPTLNTRKKRTALLDVPENMDNLSEKIKNHNRK